MSDIPVPLTRSQILGSMIETLLSKLGLKSLKVGSPVLSILETVAQSQLRVSDDIFTMLRSIALEVATGPALDRIGADEYTPRLQETAASGYVTISDSSFKKISSTIFQGTAPPIVGSSTVNLVDASSFTPTGNIYIGRNTQNFEGPLPYTSIDPPGVSGGNYYKIHLTGSTLRFHNIGEEVVLAQGGNRQISAGTIVQTPQGSVTNAVQFSVLYTVSLADGEDTLDNVFVVSSLSGLIGNVSKESISSFSSSPFTGASVTNPEGFSNGRNLERDESYRERIRQRRFSRALGTPTALKSYSLGVESTEENTSVTSNSIVTKQGEPAVLYIDDGSGYEEKHTGIAIENIFDRATGGEQYFKTSKVPVSKAVCLSTLSSPYVLENAGKLALKVGGVSTEHTFDQADFTDISSASAYEVCASINKNSTLLWSARTYNGGTQVALYAKADENDDVEISTASNNDQISAFGFPTEIIYTTRLYKNDQLLTKDGNEATVYSKPYSQWQSLSSPQTLTIEVDGVELVYDGTTLDAFTDQDFIDANTGYSVLGKNSIEAWVKVFNKRIPGITASAVGSTISFTSNRGRSSLASVKTSSGSLISNNMFYDGDTDSNGRSFGKTKDYSLNRNTGEIKIETPLTEDDSLSLGTAQTRAFLQTEVNSFQFSADADFWFIPDGAAEIISTGLSAGTSLSLTTVVRAWGITQKMSHASAFANVQVGDWIIFWDSALAAYSISGAYRVNFANGTLISVDVASGLGHSGSVTLAQGGVQIIRSLKQTVKASLSYQTGGTNNTYTASTVADYFNSLSGIECSVYRTNNIRTSSVSYGLDRDIAFIAKNAAGSALNIEPANAITNLQSHLASVETQNGSPGTPFFQRMNVNSGDSDTVSVNSFSTTPYFSGIPSNYYVNGLFADNDSDTDSRWGIHKGFNSSIATVTGTTLDLRNIGAQAWLASERIGLNSPYTIYPTDYLTLVIDQDPDAKQFVVPFARTLKPSSSTYGGSNTFYDGDNGNVSLSHAFGYGSDSFSFEDFAVWMPARVKNTQDATILWRYYRLGPDGNGTEQVYSLPDGPNATPSLKTDPRLGFSNRIKVVLGSGAERTGYSLNTGYPVGVIPSNTTSGMTTIYYILAFKVISFTRTSNVATIRLQYPDANVKNSGLGQNLFNFVTSSAAPSGTWDFTGVTISEWVPASGVFDKFVFSNTGVDVSTVSGNVGAMYFASSVTQSFIDGSPAVSQYDYVRSETGSGFPAEFVDFTSSIINNPVTDKYFIKILVPNFTGIVTNTVSYYNINTNYFSIFANANMSGTNLVSAINALTNPVLTGKVIASGSSVIHLSTEESAASTSNIPILTDGINYIGATVKPVTIIDDYSFGFKNAVTASLATNSDWLNETIKLVPVTVKNVVDWLNNLSITGLSESCNIDSSYGGNRVQITSLTPGSVGSVKAQGGRANLATAAIVGSSELVDSTNDTAISYIRKGDADGLFSGSWVSVDNANKLNKSGTIFNSSTQITSLDSSGVLTFDVGTVIYTVITEENSVAKIEKDGKFICISTSGIGGLRSNVEEGDYVQFTTFSGTSGVEINSFNQGIFRIVRLDNNSSNRAFWIENPVAVEQVVCDCHLRFITAESIVPGDVFTISTPFFGAGNMGDWEVVDVGNGYTTTTVMTVSQANKSVVPFASGPGVIGSNYTLLKITEGTPFRAVKQIASIIQSEDPDYYYIKYTSPQGYGFISENGGSVLTALDKLNFSLDTNLGIDGYAYSTGLVQEVNKVLYGDPSNSTIYPGVVSTGAKVNIEGPLIKRIQFSLQIRIEKGFSKEIISNKVKNTVAATVNAYGVGESISISDILKEAQKITGIKALVVLSPIYDPSNDLISVQPFERAKVLNSDTDISIVFVGT